MSYTSQIKLGIGSLTYEMFSIQLFILDFLYFTF